MQHSVIDTMSLGEANNRYGLTGVGLSLRYGRLLSGGTRGRLEPERAGGSAMRLFGLTR